MAQQRKNKLYIILALILCAGLLLPYLGVLELISGPADRSTGSSYSGRRTGEGARATGGDLPRELPTVRSDTQKNKLSDIERMLDE